MDETPEQYRKRLLKELFEDVDRVRDSRVHGIDLNPNSPNLVKLAFKK